MNAPIRYFGGKNTMAKKIIEHFPNLDEIETYIEPFGGSYGVGFSLKKLPPNEIYNDLERNVYSLYKVLSDKDMFERFKDRCDISYVCDDIRKEYKELLRNELSMEDRAFYFFYVNRTSFNGIGGFTANLVVRRGMSKTVSDFLSSIEKLPEIHQRLSRVIVMNTDGIELIKRYDKENVFLVCDPPYVHSTRTNTRYDIDMDDELQNKFIDACINNNKAKIMISGYDNALYKRLEDNGFKKISFEVNTVGGDMKPKQKIECLWINY